ncbi:MAG: ATP-binding protein [Treponema sp.]|jgi:predicted AAA+ superfamily ATPase|nr:ATP-binding protein [Treponema sp.]
MNAEDRGDDRLVPTRQAALSVLADLAGLTLFRSCRKQPLFRAFRLLLEEWAALSPKTAGSRLRLPSPGKNPGRRFPQEGLLCRWAAFMRELGAAPAPDGDTGHSFFSRLWECVLCSDENPFTLAAERGIINAENETGANGGPSLLAGLAAGDLDRLNRIAAFDISALGFSIGLCLRSCGLEDAAAALEAEARIIWHEEARKVRPAGPQTRSPEDFAAYIRRYGAGILGRRGFFRWDRGLRPILNADPLRLRDLSGYDAQRSLVTGNTLGFLEGKAANNLLLYGDRGTGKSATVKAVCREYLDRGLRLVELRSKDAAELPALLEFTASRGLKFVIFIDDLSFEGLDDSFTGFKTLLEGSAAERPRNTVIYATSNRRHLVRERRTDQPAPPGSGDNRSFDTMQEQLSLSDRFGLTVFFNAPSREEYLDIARFIAERRGLTPGEKFRENALRWEQWFNGRSPRTASQFVDWLNGEKPFPWD